MAESKMQIVSSKYSRLSSFRDLRGRIGILGGSFDPIHKGHLHIAREAMRKHGLDQVVFIPAGENPDKEHLPQALRHERLAMVEAALKDEQDFFVSSIEINKSGPSYTFQTLEKIQSTARPDTKLFFIVGADCLESLAVWDCFDRILKAVSLVTVDRSGIDRETRASLLRKFEYVTSRQLRDHFVSAKRCQISSTEIRLGLASNHEVVDYLPRGVPSYIAANSLYSSTKCRGE